MVPNNLSDFDNYGIIGTPIIFVLDRKGVIQGRYARLKVGNTEKRCFVPTQRGWLKTKLPNIYSGTIGSFIVPSSKTLFIKGRKM